MITISGFYKVILFWFLFALCDRKLEILGVSE